MQDVKKCFIVGAGSFNGMRGMPGPGDLVIAADGGYRYLEEMGVRVDVLLGDFDSLERVPAHEHLIRHSPIKDDTDMALAAYYAVECGCRELFLYGGMGGRLDHTLANIQLLTGLSRDGIRAWLIGENNILTVITEERLVFTPECRGMISVFAMGERAAGVYERGLKYGLDCAELTCGRALGVSNEFTGQESSIWVRSGSLLIMWDEKNGFPSCGPLQPQSIL